MSAIIGTPSRVESAQASPISIRRTQPGDGRALLRLIVALAEFEKLPPPDAEAQKRLLADGLGHRARLESWLAFWDGAAEPVAYALLFETYSSFLARPSLYLEDIFVLPAFRRRGVGRALLRHCIQMAHERGCGRMEWTCLDWNTKAQTTYDQLGARRLSEWFLYRLTLSESESLSRMN